VINEIDSESLQGRLSEGEDFVLVDIRTPAEMAQGIIPGSSQLPMQMIPLKMNELPKDKDVVLYCRSGARSYQACAYLMQQGFERVINLRGGIIAWARHGYPIGRLGG
jgi:rhodanese-related sulfurtransferase